MPHVRAYVVAAEVIVAEVKALTSQREDLADLVKPLIDFLQQQSKDATETNTMAVVYSLSPAEAEQDLMILDRLTPRKPDGLLEQFVRALRGGLQGDPEFDWIKRVKDSEEDSKAAPVPTPLIHPGVSVEDVQDLF